jgi:hypothetical protein
MSAPLSITITPTGYEIEVTSGPLTIGCQAWQGIMPNGAPVLISLSLLMSDKSGAETNEALRKACPPDTPLQTISMELALEMFARRKS